MQYHGQLYGHIPGTRKYFDTGKSSADWDRMEQTIASAAKDTKRMDWMADSYAAAGMDHQTAEREARVYEQAYREAKRRGLADRLAVRGAVDAAIAFAESQGRKSP